MTHTEPKNMIDHLINYLQHNWILGSVGPFFTGVILSITNSNPSILNEILSYGSAIGGLVVAGLSAYAKILEIRNNRKIKK